MATVTEAPLRRIVIHNAAPDEQRSCGRTIEVVRGKLLPEYFNAVVIPEYQRNPIVNGTKHGEIYDALDPDTGAGIPDDISLCVRNGGYTYGGSGEIIIETDALIALDGHQRINGAWARLGKKLKCSPLGAKIYLNTSFEEEVYLFYQMNRLQTPVSPHVLLRNAATTPAMKALLALGDLPGFPQIQMQAERQDGDKISTHKLYTIAIILHGHHAKKNFEEMIATLDKVGEYIGTERMADNVRIFFELVKRIFGEPLKPKQGEEPKPNLNAAYMYRRDLLYALAKLFSRHLEFWDSRASNKLQVSAIDIAKLARTHTRVIEQNLESKSAYASLATTFRSRFAARAGIGEIKLTERTWDYPEDK